MDCGCILMLVSVGLGLILTIAGGIGYFYPEARAPEGSGVVLIIGIVLLVAPFVGLWIATVADSKRREKFIYRPKP